MPLCAEFSEAVVAQAFDDSKGSCQCQLTACGHMMCGETFRLEDRATAHRKGWETHYNTALASCQILCTNCHTIAHKVS